MSARTVRGLTPSRWASFMAGPLLARVEQGQQLQVPDRGVTHGHEHGTDRGTVSTALGDIVATMTTATSSVLTDPTQPLQGRGALVTGGSRGIGRAVVRQLAADGATVAFTYNTRAQDAETVAAEITARGDHAYPVPLDIADPAQFTTAYAAVDKALRHAGIDGLDIVVANAGVFSSAVIADVTVEEWDRVMAVNARGTMLTIKHAISRLRDNGRIITLSTIGTQWPSPGEAAYAASKAAVEQLTRICSRELGPRGITANTIAAGPTDTDLLRDNTEPQALDGAAAMTALGRIGQPADIANLVALIAHPDSGWMTGQNIRADGGLS
jgi:3-oxoacyl-[acyl-carrier protein] reductase